jgi:hypothetical protein
LFLTWKKNKIESQKFLILAFRYNIPALDNGERAYTTNKWKKWDRFKKWEKIKKLEK